MRSPRDTGQCWIYDCFSLLMINFAELSCSALLLKQKELFSSWLSTKDGRVLDPGTFFVTWPSVQELAHVVLNFEVEHLVLNLH